MTEFNRDAAVAVVCVVVVLFVMVGALIAVAARAEDGNRQWCASLLSHAHTSHDTLLVYTQRPICFPDTVAPGR